MSYGREVKTIVSPGGILPGNTVFEQVKVGEAVEYAVKPPDGEVSIEPFLKIGEHVMYQPLSPSPWLLPPPPEPYVSLENLWSLIRQYVHEHVDFEVEAQYDVFVAWVLATWTLERWDSVPYLWFTGPSNSGKTRCLDVLNQLCYRPLLSPSVSAASVYRALDSFHPTFLLDEFEMYEKMRELKAEVIGVLNAGYRRGQVVLRTDKVRDGAPVLKGFSCFGFKAITSIMPLPTALEGRTIPLVMSKAVRKVRRLIDKEKAQELRAMLLQYRFDHFADPPPAGNPLDLPDGRLIELYTPLAAVAPETVEPKILGYALRQLQDSLEAERETDDAQVFLTIVDMLEERPAKRIPQKNIRERLNALLPQDEQFSKQKVGVVLKRLGFRSAAGEKRLLDVLVDSAVLQRRAERYLKPEEREKISKIIANLNAIDTVVTVDTVVTEDVGLSASGKPTPPLQLLQKCEVCGKPNAKLHIIPGKGERWFCDACAAETLEPI